MQCYGKISDFLDVLAAYKFWHISTLESGIEVGPTLINLAFFSRPYGLIRDYIKVI